MLHFSYIYLILFQPLSLKKDMRVLYFHMLTQLFLNKADLSSYCVPDFAVVKTVGKSFFPTFSQFDV